VENLCVYDAQRTLGSVHMIEMSARYRLICKIKPTTAQLAKLDKRQSAEQEVVSSTLARPTLRVLKYLRRMYRLCCDIYKWLDIPVFSDKDEKL